jgi:hypothetical protein
VAAAPRWADAVDAVRIRMMAVLAANLIMLMRVSQSSPRRRSSLAVLMVLNWSRRREDRVLETNFM